MARGRKKLDSSRDHGGFVALPWSVLDSAAYLSLSAHAKALLLEVARQYHRDDNGRMLLSRKYLAPRGWNSSDMIMKAKRELLEAELIFETAKGMRPNKASWYACTFYSLDKILGFDPGVEQAFERGAYRKKNGACLRPSGGTEKPAIAPPHGTGTPLAVPPHGAIRPIFDPLSVPQDGHPQELPSTGVRIEGGLAAVESDSEAKKGGKTRSRAVAPKAAWICRHPGCETIALKRYCDKHRNTAVADTAAAGA